MLATEKNMFTWESTRFYDFYFMTTEMTLNLSDVQMKLSSLTELYQEGTCRSVGHRATTKPLGQSLVMMKNSVLS